MMSVCLPDAEYSLALAAHRGLFISLHPKGRKKNKISQGTRINSQNTGCAPEIKKGGQLGITQFTGLSQPQKLLTRNAELR